jgi:hypothetical protein
VLYDNEAAAGVIAYQATLGTDRFLVVLNTSDGNTLMSELPTGLPGGTQLDVLESQQFIPPCGGSQDPASGTADRSPRCSGAAGGADPQRRATW